MKARLGAVIALFAVSCVISSANIQKVEVASAHTAGPQVVDESGWLLGFESPPSTTTAPAPIATESSQEAREFSDADAHISVETYNPPTARELVDQIFGWPGAQIVNCESLWNPLAVGKAGERGLFQIHPVHARPGGVIERMGYTWDQMFEVEPNIRVAAQIRKESGLRAWSCWTGG